ncbi:hypothetical protein A0H81_11635 [Grifola frondosa]|uniref:Uncharacterized protein n=1 Tax=Grifola frondosa TaxID=5627 RepID=A0A1C7LUM5_GRIFR|nr:hypothetical protein A0H81_11635 [Grifola frondosa]
MAAPAPPSLPQNPSLPPRPASGSISAATVSAAPELRDFKKESIAFVPSTLKRKRPGAVAGSTSKVNAAPSLGPPSGTEEPEAVPAARPDLLSALRDQFGTAPVREAKTEGAKSKSDYENTKDWRRHKPECKLLSTVGLDRQEGYPFTVKAVLFPVDGDTPRIIDVHYKLRQTPDGSNPHILQHIPDFGPWLGSSKPRPASIQKDGLNGRPLGRSLLLVCDDSFQHNGSAPNTSIQRIIGEGGHKSKWAGHVLGFREREPAVMIAQLDDIKLEDVEVFKKYFREGHIGRHILNMSNYPELPVGFDWAADLLAAVPARR